MLPITSTSRLILLATALLFSSCSILQSRVSESDVKQLIQESFSEARPSGGRLFSSSHAPITTDQANSAIGRAQLLLLQLPESPSTRRLQADIHIGSAGWSKAAEVLEALLEDRPYEWALNNDLGVVYLEMGREESCLHIQGSCAVSSSCSNRSRSAGTIVQSGAGLSSPFPSCPGTTSCSGLPRQTQRRVGCGTARLCI